jgi:homoserine dehydrogenase
VAAGISVVTPNKKAFSASQGLFDAIFTAADSNDASVPRGLVYHEASVGAGMPVISTLKDLVETGDQVRCIEGVMSGSLSFLFNGFMPLSSSGGQGGGKWSDAVLKAKELGYTEPDPRDDLSGLDVARKLVILARVAGLKVEGTHAFNVESLIPEELADAASGDEFLTKLPQFDDRMERLRKNAAEKGVVLRYVGRADLSKGELKVGLQEVSTDSPLAGLKGSQNVFSFYTQRYGETPLVVVGAGAGGEVTAMGVTADLIKVVQRLG